jgi:hypothetical protein
VGIVLLMSRYQADLDSLTNCLMFELKTDTAGKWPNMQKDLQGGKWSNMQKDLQSGKWSSTQKNLQSGKCSCSCLRSLSRSNNHLARDNSIQAATS